MWFVFLPSMENNNNNNNNNNNRFEELLHLGKIMPCVARANYKIEKYKLKFLTKILSNNNRVTVKQVMQARLC